MFSKSTINNSIVTCFTENASKTGSSPGYKLKIDGTPLRRRCLKIKTRESNKSRIDMAVLQLFELAQVVEDST